MRTSLGILAAVLALGAAGAAHAQATRTWVSGVGDDANPCSRTAPCKTFAGAINKTATGGEIDALDPADFGAVTITKAMTLDGTAAFSGIGNAATNGITVSAGASDVVVLRGLSLRGSGTGSGVAVVSAGFVQLEHSFVAGFADGVALTPAAGAQVLVSDVVVKDCSGAGILVGSAGGTTRVTITNARAEGNGVGVRAIAGGRVGVYDSEASRNGTGVAAELDGGGGAAEINLESVATSENGGVGVSATAVAGTAVVRMSKVLATNNATAPFASSGGGSVQSFGNNRLDLVPALALSSTVTTQTVTAGQHATYAVDVAVTGLTSAPIAFACSGLPPGASCTFAPATLPAGTTSGTVTLTVSTTDANGMSGFLSRGGGDGGAPLRRTAALLALLLLALSLVSLRQQRAARLRRPLGAALALALFVGGVGAIAACGSSPGKSTPDLSMPAGDDLGGDDGGMTAPDLATSPTPTPAGSYSITVTGTSGALTGTLPLTLVVN